MLALIPSKIKPYFEYLIYLFHVHFGLQYLNTCSSSTSFVFKQFFIDNITFKLFGIFKKNQGDLGDKRILLFRLSLCSGFLVFLYLLFGEVFFSDFTNIVVRPSLSKSFPAERPARIKWAVFTLILFRLGDLS